MIVVALTGAVVAVLLGLSRPSARGVEARLASEPVRGRPPGRRPLIVAGGVVVALAPVAAAGVLAGPRGAVVGMAGLIVLAVAGWLVRQRARAAAALRAQVDVARACQLLASHVRVGQVPATALAVTASDCPVLREALHVHEVGGDVATVWRRQARRPGHGGLAELARAWQVSGQTGAPLSATLEQVATSLSSEESLRAVVAGELASPRASSKVMAALPVCGIALGYLLGGDPVAWLLSGPVGWACLLTGLLLAAAGVVWIELLARRAAGPG